MLLKRETLDGIVSGTVTLQFRRWTKPTVKAGGTLLTAVGQIAIDSVEVVEAEDVDDAQARAAGFSDRDRLFEMLDAKKKGDLHRITLHYAGPDPRVALRESLPNERELSTIRKRLTRWDAASPVGPWTRSTLEVIEARPATLAAKLAEEIGMELARFKPNVRKLKGLGLTESLKVGYRLSPRGAAVLTDLNQAGGTE